jgi:hypothetical protein
MPITRPHLVAIAPIALLPALALLASAADPRADDPSGGEAGAQPIVCDCELRSWVVAGRGRHMLLDIDCPEAFDDLDGVVEFTTASYREDYDAALDRAEAPRIARMTPGVRLQPFIAPNGGGFPKERVEASWTIPLDTARCLQRDRLFANRYALLGPNSNSAMAVVLEACGLDAPDAVLGGAGVFGEFPGVDLDPGEEIPRAAWPDFGIPFSRE